MYSVALENAHVAFRVRNFGVAFRALKKASDAAAHSGDPRAPRLAELLAELELGYHNYGRIWNELLELAPQEAKGAQFELWRPDR
jgi:hypothetical protein